MARNSQGVTAIEDEAGRSDPVEDLNVWDEYMGKDTGKSNAMEAVETSRIAQGFRAYVRDLPGLLNTNHEGHMVAYLGDRQVGIADSDEKLHQMLVSQPNYAKKKTELFVTRVTELDADELGIRI